MEHTIKPDSELLEAQLEANAISQAYQQAFSNEMDSRRNVGYCPNLIAGGAE